MIKLKFLVVLAAIFSTGFASDNMSSMNNFRFPTPRMSVEDFRNLPEAKKLQHLSMLSDCIKSKSIFLQRNGFQNAVRHGYLSEIDGIGATTPYSHKKIMGGVINEVSNYPNDYPGFNLCIIKMADANTSQFDYNVSSNAENFFKSLNISSDGSIESIAKQLEKVKNEVAQKFVSVAPAQSADQVNVTKSAPQKQLSLSEIRKIHNEQFKDKSPTDAEKHDFLDSMGF